METKEDLKELVNMLEQAVDQVYDEERPLFEFENEERKGLEQAFAFRVGLYFWELLKLTKFSELDLDMEYNKFFGQSKYSDDGNLVRPDMILHERNTQKNNIMVIEFKGWWNDDCSDSPKLKMFTKPKGKYKYKIGVFVKLRQDMIEYKYFLNG